MVSDGSKQFKRATDPEWQNNILFFCCCFRHFNMGTVMVTTRSVLLIQKRVCTLQVSKLCLSLSNFAAGNFGIESDLANRPCGARSQTHTWPCLWFSPGSHSAVLASNCLSKKKHKKKPHTPRLFRDLISGGCTVPRRDVYVCLRVF